MTKQAIEKGNKCKTEIGIKIQELNCYIAFLESGLCILSDRSKVRHINNKPIGPQDHLHVSKYKNLGFSWVNNCPLLTWLVSPPM